MSSHANNTVSEILVATELNSLLNIVAFFDWDTFKKFETLDYNDDEGFDINDVKEYVIETFKSLVAKAHQENDDYRWTEGRYHLRFEYRKNIGLHLMYVPLQEGED